MLSGQPSVIAEFVSAFPSPSDRIDRLDWQCVAAALDASGFAIARSLLDPSECRELVELYAREENFRSRVIMSRHGFGRGEYKYFSNPLPALVEELRNAAYARLSPIANDWHSALELKQRFPRSLPEFLRICHDAGQTRPTPLLLKYGPGDFNCLHQDVYGPHVFPIQMAVLLSEPATDFEGGEFALTEQRPRMQSRVEVVNLRRGDAVFFAVNFRPVKGVRGHFRTRVRHGVSQVRSGARYTLGVIFHDAT